VNVSKYFFVKGTYFFILLVCKLLFNLFCMFLFVSIACLYLSRHSWQTDLAWLLAASLAAHHRDVGQSKTAEKQNGGNIKFFT